MGGDSKFADIIDTHQHLVYRGDIGYSWTDDLDALKVRNFTLSDYAQLTAGRGIAQTLFMEAGVDDADYKNEARFVSSLVATGGLVGAVVSCRPEDDAGFDAWLDEALALQVKGFRRILHEVSDDVSQADTFRKNLRKIGKAGLPFDICMFARQHGITIELLKACPDQQFVLDHCGNPDIAAGGFESWARTMRQLVSFPNLAVKMSGIAVNCAPGTATLDTMRPYVLHLIELFGADRVVWGSDWPVVDLGCGLPDWIDISRAILGDFSHEEQAMIAHENARRIYGL
ncbi:MAG: amidohydrolase family protein [Rhizobiaceae bacterium]